MISLFSSEGRIPLVIALVAGGLYAATPAGLEAQAAGDRTRPLVGPIESSVAVVPFGPGERMEYDVHLGRLRVGAGSMEVEGVEPVRGESSYHVSMRIQGGVPLARVDDHYQSWFDIQTLSSRRFIQDTDQVRRRRHRHFEIYPAQSRWQRMDVEDGGEMDTTLPLDDIAFLYYVRTLDLEVGETYELNQYFRADRNPVILQVLRRETVEVPAGTFKTIVVRPIIKAGGLFGEGGEAEVYFTDDEDRVLVRLESRVPVIGSLSLRLTKSTPGRRLAR